MNPVVLHYRQVCSRRCRNGPKRVEKIIRGITDPKKAVSILMPKGSGRYRIHRRRSVKLYILVMMELDASLLTDIRQRLVMSHEW